MIRVNAVYALWLSLILSVSGGQAQYSGTGSGTYTGALSSTWNNPISAYLSVVLVNDINRRSLQASLTSSGAGTPASTRSTYQYPLTKTDFKFKGQPTQQRDCAVMTDDPTTRQQLAELCLSLFQQIEGNKDFRRHNLSAALTLLIGASWQVSEGKEFTDERLEAMQRTLNDQLTGGGAMHKLRAPDIQHLYERSVMIGGLVLALSDQEEQPSRDLAKALAQSVLRSFGLKK